MVPLLIWLENVETGAKQSFAFDSSPVRIGRNKLNELELVDARVSQWHGVVRCSGDTAIGYIDLGSTNGTLVNGERVPKQVEVGIDPQTVLQIGQLRLRFGRALVPPQLLTRRKSAFLGAPEDIPIGAHTMIAADTGPTPADPKMVAGIAAQIAPVYQDFERVSDAMQHYVRHYVHSLPEYQRAGMLLALGDRFPRFKRTPMYSEIARAEGIGQHIIGDVDVEDWLRRLLPDTDGKPAAKGGLGRNTVRTMETVGALLETFAQAFVDLRGGHEQFLEEIGIRLNADSGLRNLKTSRAVLAYLLEGGSDGHARSAELQRGFADLALHQVGLMNGVVEGVRSLLAGIAPETLAGVPAQPRSRAVREGGGGFLGGKAKLWWQSFAKRHADLEEGDRFTRDVFGKAFASAYLMVMGNVRK